MTDTRPFDPALFREDAIVAGYRETERTDDPVDDRIAGMVDHRRRGFRAARRRGEGPFPAPVMSSRARPSRSPARMATKFHCA